MAEKYEIIVVFNPDINQDGIKAYLDKVEALVKNHDGVIEKQDHWGRKYLAYPINKHNYGYYVVLIVSSKGTLITELRRQLKISDEIIRSLVVKKDKYAPDLSSRLKGDSYSSHDRLPDAAVPELDLVEEGLADEGLA